MLPRMADKDYEERLKILQIPSLTYRRMRGDMLEVYKMTSGEYGPEAIPELQFLRNSTTRGHSKKLFHQRQHIPLEGTSSVIESYQYGTVYQRKWSVLLIRTLSKTDWISSGINNP